MKYYFLAWSILAILGLVAFFTLYERAFPTASIDLSLTKDEITDRAVQYASFMTYKREEAVIATRFTSDDSAKNFLDYKLGVEEANRLMRSEIPVWMWQTRICKPFSTEEGSVLSSTSGKILGFSHSIAREKKVASISHTRARELVEKFAEQTVNVPVSKWKVIEDQQEKKVNRVDHVFVFEEKAKQYKGARLRARFEVYGDYIGAYSRYLHVPEDFTREYGKLRSNNQLLQTIASTLGYCLTAAGVFVLIWAIRTRMIRWKLAFRVAGISAIVFTLTFLNFYPMMVYSYDTSKSFFDYLFMQFGMFVLGVGALSIYFALMVASAEALYRKVYPERIAVENMFGKKGLRDKSTLIGLVLALCYLCFSLGYQCVFYVVGREMGVWCPINVRDESILGMLFPPIGALFMGYYASLDEEITYRILGIALFTRVFKNPWIANLVQAVLWGFAHSSYPQQPAYTRGVELSIEGFISGAFYIKFGILPSLISHYLFNVTVSSIPSFCAESLSSKLCALIPYVPVLLWLILVVVWVKKKGFLSLAEAGSRNLDIPVEKALEPDRSPGSLISFAIQRPDWKVLRFLVAVAVIFLASGWYLNSRSHVFGVEEKPLLSRAKMVEKTSRALEEHGISTKDYRVTTWSEHPCLYDQDEIQYIFEKAGFVVANKYVKQLLPSYVYKARWYKPLAPQEYEVTLTADGKLRSIDIKLHEKDSGASLSEAKAKELAQAFLARHHQELDVYKFSSATKVVKDARVDYTIVYEMPEHKVADAPLMITVEVVGDKVGQFYTGWQVPNQWLLERQKKELWQICLDIYRNALYGIGALCLLIVAIKLIAKEGFSIKFTAYVFLFALAYGVISNINSWPEVYKYYSTETPLASFQSRQVIARLYSVFETAVTFSIVSVLSYASAKAVLGDNLTTYFKQFLPARFLAVEDRPKPSIWLYSIFSVFFAILLSRASGFFIDKYLDAFSPSVRVQDFAFIRFLQLYSVSLKEISDALFFGVGFCMALPVVAYIYKKYVRTSKRCIILVLLVLPTSFTSSYFVIEGFYSAVYFLIGLVLSLVFAIRIFKNNLLAYFLLVYYTTVLFAVAQLCRFVYPNLAMQLYLLIFACFLPVLICVDDLLVRRSTGKRGSED